MKPHASRSRRPGVRALVAAAAVLATAGVVPVVAASASAASASSEASVTPAPVFPRADGITLKQAAKRADATAPDSCDHAELVGRADCGAIVTPITSNAGAPTTSQVTPQATRPSGVVDTRYAPYFSPAVIRPLYGIPASAASTATIAIITVGSDPLLSARLNHYRATFHLAHDPATGDESCTADNGCLTEIPGDPDATALPPEDTDWAVETNLDTQAVSAVCPTCNLLVVDATDAYNTEIEQAVTTAVTHGADYVSMSLGGDDAGLTPEPDSIFTTPGVAFFASSGDDGYQASWPATAPGVLSVGGTHTTVDLSGHVTNTAWELAGAGCSAGMPANAQAAQNRATAAACGRRRASADLAALADPHTGLVGYYGDGTDGADEGLVAFGGTSLAAPLVAAMYALAGNHTDTEAIYANAAAHPGAFADVTSVNGGGTGVQGCPGGVRVCTVRAGWDGPTGLGVPTGLQALVVGGGSTRTTAPTRHPYVAQPILAAGTPRVAGAPRVGKKLKAKVPAFRNKNGTAIHPKVTVVWYVNGHQAKRAKNLKLRKAWRGKKVTYTVTVTAPGYQSLTVRSKAVKVKR